MNSEIPDVDLATIRRAMANFEISPRVEPNEQIDLGRVFFPEGHRAVLDLRRQLVVGNRGTGKSFWTHALTNQEVRKQVARAYSFPRLAQTEVMIGFNGSTKISKTTPTIEDIRRAHSAGHNRETIWQAVMLSAIRCSQQAGERIGFADTLHSLTLRPREYAETLTSADDKAYKNESSILVVFDALDKLSNEWGSIRELTKGLLLTVAGLQSFRSIRAKVFMRVDQFGDTELFRFPDSSKIRNDRVDLSWRAQELYGLLTFELMRDEAAASALGEVARSVGAQSALPAGGHLNVTGSEQEALITALAGEYMGKDRKRGRVYTWVPLHLSDASNTCSPRTFLTAWKTAAEHQPIPRKLVVDHLGLNEGVRIASSTRLTELREDYPWIDLALAPLRRQFVPIAKDDLFDLWRRDGVTERILSQAGGSGWLTPIGVSSEANIHSEDGLLQTMTSISVMEQRANGKINVPDIFRVEAQILRKGGVAVARRS
ncbi:MAG: hypothetical protein IT168_06190 [Bryobacterales bacterium]|nr:hypothetical protein [Bryobacterales bacterium]